MRRANNPVLFEYGSNRANVIFIGNYILDIRKNKLGNSRQTSDVVFVFKFLATAQTTKSTICASGSFVMAASRTDIPAAFSTGYFI
jgi:hypothetical protein